MIGRLRQRYAVRHEPLRSERRVEFVVLVLALVVLLQLLWLIGRYVATSQVRPVPPAPDSLTVVSRTQLDTLTPQQSMEVLARPLFFASRRPLGPLPDIADLEGGANDDKKAGSLKGLKVLGIVENGKKSRVIVSFKGEQRRLARGESIEGWRLSEVAPGRAVLENGDERDERTLSPMPVTAAAPAREAADGANSAASAVSTAAETRRAAAARREAQLEQRRENAVQALSAGGALMDRQSGNGAR